MPYDHHAVSQKSHHVCLSKIPRVVFSRGINRFAASPARSSILRKQQSTAPAPNSTAPGCVVFLDDKAARIQSN